MDKLFINKDNKRLGPFSPDKVKQLAKEGKISLEDLLWIPTENKWIKIKNIKSLRELFEKDKEESKYYIRIGQSTLGPLSKEEVLSMIELERITGDSLVYFDDKWQKAKTVFKNEFSDEIVEPPPPFDEEEFEPTPPDIEDEKEPVGSTTMGKSMESTSIDGTGSAAIALDVPIPTKEYRKYIEEREDDSKALLNSFISVIFLYTLIFLSAFYVKQPEIEKTVKLPEPDRVAKLLVPESKTINLGPEEAPEVVSTTGGSGGGSGGGYAGGGGGGGEGTGSAGVLGLITSKGEGGGIVDILGKSGSGGDLDSILSGKYGLVTEGIPGEGGGGGTGLGLGDGLGLGGGGGIEDLLSGLEEQGGSGGELDLKKSYVTISSPSGITGAGASSGQRQSNVIRSIVESHRVGIEYAYKKYLKSDPTLSGKITVQFTISAGGSVTSVSVISSSIGLSSLESDIVSQIYSWRFPPITEGNVTVIYPFVFTPGI
jgi:TonB family protein